MTDRAVTRILWEAANEPAGDGDVGGACRVCGMAGVGLSFQAWVRNTFTDWDKLLPGEIICHACQFAFCESSAELALRVGKAKPQRMRNYSHFVEAGEWIPLSKAHKREMAEVLARGPQVAVVADSGQKHLIFRAVPGVVQFEEQVVRDVGIALALIGPLGKLLTAFSKAEIRAGRYAQHRVLKFGLGQWRALEQEVRGFRGSRVLALALFLAQKENGNAHRDRTDGGGAADGDLAGGPGGIQEPLPDFDMAAV